MRTFGFVTLAFVLGLVAGFAATVLGGLAWMEYAGVFDRDGGLSMGIFFGLGPLGGLAGGVLAALATWLRLNRKKKQVAAGTRPPAQRWPLRTRAVVAALVWGIGIWLAMQGVYWLLSPMAFESYATAVVVSWLPLAATILAAALATGFVLWRRAPGAI